jgi:hypothetical protein
MTSGLCLPIECPNYVRYPFLIVRQTQSGESKVIRKPATSKRKQHMLVLAGESGSSSKTSDALLDRPGWRYHRDSVDGLSVNSA